MKSIPKNSFYSNKNLKFEALKFDPRAKYLNTLDDTEVAFLKLFYPKRACKKSALDICNLLNMRDKRTTKFLIQRWSKEEFFSIKHNAYKYRKNTAGKNSLLSKQKCRDYLKAILNKAYTGEEVPFELQPITRIKNGATKSLRKAEIEALKKKLDSQKKNRKNETRKNDHLLEEPKGSNPKCQEQPADCGFPSSFDEMKERLTNEELKKCRLLPKKLLDTANGWNIFRLFEYTAQEIVKALKSLMQKKNIRHPWKFFTYLLNKIKNQRHLFSWHNQLSKNYLDAVNDVKNKHTEKLLNGIDSRRIIDAMREYEKHEELDLKKLSKIIRRAKGNTSKIANDIEILLSRAKNGGSTNTKPQENLIQRGDLKGKKDPATGLYYFPSLNAYKSVETVIVYRTPDNRKFENLKEAIGHCESRKMPFKVNQKSQSTNPKMPKLKSLYGFWYWLSGQNFESKSDFYTKKSTKEKKQ